MIRTYADNAILAKVRALYGKRLLQSDYEQLMSKKSVGEVAAFLKKETYYAENLQEVREELVHRGQLENLIRRRPLEIYKRLLKYAYQETFFLRLYVMKGEIEQLLVAIRLLNADSSDQYIISLPGYLARMMSFDLYQVAHVRSFDDLLELLEHSPYYRIVGRFRPTGEPRMIDITGCEAALLTYYYQTAIEMAERDYRGETRANLKQLLEFRANVHNLSTIFRLRRYHNAPRELIAARIVQVEGLPEKLYTRMLDAPDIAALEQMLNSARIFRRYSIDWGNGAQQVSGQLHRLHRTVNQRMFRFSRQPVVTVLSYMALLETEIDNIVSIIEGIRYGVSPGELKALLAL